MQYSLLPRRLKNFWDEWGIELLVIVSCGMHIVLTLYGSRRRYIKNILVRFIIWSAYLLSAYVVTLIFGKFTIIPISDTARENTDSELRAVLAPLLLVQLGSRDAITAYSIEDDRLGQRQILSLFAHFNAVFWILVRCWTNSRVSYLYFPLFIAGCIKYGENVWALSTALTGSSGITISEFREEDLVKTPTEEHVPIIFKDLDTIFKDQPDQDRYLKMITTAYYRFVCSKPHIENWLYKPLYQDSVKYTSIKNCEPHEKFIITDLELGFMYDVLYTKFPIIYTWIGFALRLISSITLFSTSIAICILLKDSFIYYINAGFAFVVLGVILTLECYQIYMLVFSDWAIIEMVKHSHKPTVKRFLRLLAPQSIKWKRWSNKLDQFNLISYCHKQKKYGFLTKLFYITTLFKFQGLDTDIKKYLCTGSRVKINGEFKKMLIEEMKKVDNKRNSKPVDDKRSSKPVDDERSSEPADDKRGTEPLNSYAGPNNEFEGKDLDKRIIIWHLATEICYHHPNTAPDKNANPKIDMVRMVRYLSNYMMYLLAIRPQMLCITTSDIVFDHACGVLTESLLTNGHVKNTRDEVVAQACSNLREGNFKKVTEPKGMKKTKVTKDWDVLKEAKELSENLMRVHPPKARWELICSVWVEKLCFTASNCPADFHSEQLRRGGEIVTHVWLLLLHEKDEVGSAERSTYL